MPTGFLQRREMRHTVEAQSLAQLRMVRQLCNDATIIGLEEVLQHQAGEQLMLREFLGTVRVRVEWQHALCGDKRRPRHGLRRFTGYRHILGTHPTKLAD